MAWDIAAADLKIVQWPIALFDMPNSNRFDIFISISIFSKISLKRLRLHSFGTFWTFSTESQWEITEMVY